MHKLLLGTQQPQAALSLPGWVHNDHKQSCLSVAQCFFSLLLPSQFPSHHPFTMLGSKPCCPSKPFRNDKYVAEFRATEELPRTTSSHPVVLTLLWEHCHPKALESPMTSWRQQFSPLVTLCQISVLADHRDESRAAKQVLPTQPRAALCPQDAWKSWGAWVEPCRGSRGVQGWDVQHPRAS